MISRRSQKTDPDEATPVGLHHDFFIQWHLTERCNLRCSHCYQGGEEQTELSFDEIRDVLTEIREMLRQWSETYDISFSSSYNITGGEPFLRSDFFRILEEIASQQIDIYLLTNGTLIDQDAAKRLSALGVRGVQVSIDGPQDIHDRIRGRGSFAMAMDGARELINAGLTVTLNVTLSNLNAPFINGLVSLASDARVQRLGFSRLVPCGRGKQFLHEMMDARTVKEIYQMLLSLHVDGLEIVTGDPIASQMKVKADPDAGCTAHGGCAAGISGLTLRPDGTINPCRRLSIPIGNVRKDSLREIWATSKVLSLLRDKSSYKGKCAACDRWAACRGCRAIAYAYSQSKGEADFLAEDPQCFIGE